MTRAVAVLSLSGLSLPEAEQAAADLLGDGSGADLSSLLVLDDTAALPGHGDIFGRLLTSGQVAALVCICVGPPAEPGRLPIPGSISAGLDSAVLWVGDRHGVDCRLSGSIVGRARPADGPDGAKQLAELLSSVEVFDRVRELYKHVPHGVASPGLRLAEAQSGAATFAAALTTAIGRLTAAQPDLVDAEPFADLLETRNSGQWLADDGELKIAENRVRQAARDAEDALAAVAGLRQPASAAVAQLAAAAGALGDLRLLAARLFEDGHALDELTERQRDKLRRAGVLLTEPDEAPGGRGLVAVSAVLPGTLRRPGGLPTAARRLAATERLLKPQGSRTYRDQLDECCPAALTRRLLAPPPFPPLQPWLPLVGALGAAVSGLAGIIAGAVVALAWTGLLALTVARSPGPAGAARWRLAANLAAAVAGGTAGWAASTALKPAGAVAAGGPVAGLLIAVAVAAWSWRTRAWTWRADVAADEAAVAAGTMTELVALVARRSWSSDATRLEAVARARIALDGVGDELRGYADAHAVRAGARQSADIGRMADVLAPALTDLVLAVLDAMPARSAADGQKDYQSARHETAGLIAEWDRHVEGPGPLLPPRFAREDHAVAYATGPGEEAIGTAVGYEPRDEMWQLCQPGDLHLLDASAEPLTIPFAPRTAEPVLSRVLPPGTAWTSAGHRAGLLRLVPLRDHARVTVTWGSAGYAGGDKSGEGA
jgi:hypothetical protein